MGLEVDQHRLEWPELLARVRYGEDKGFDGVWLFDHFKALYGQGPGPCFEGWTALTALAAATTRVRLGLLVTGVTYRHPSVLAAEAVTADHVSGGRLELGMGAAWFEQEHRELGIPFPPAGERLGRLEEAVEVVRLLMTTDDASFDGRYYQLRHATYRPRPVQSPHPPLWIGGSGERRTLPLAGRVADAWHSFVPPAPSSGASGTSWPSTPRRRAATPTRSCGPPTCRCPSRGTRCAPPPRPAGPTASATSSAAGPRRDGSGWRSSSSRCCPTPRFSSK